jgi:hypothetical protein
MQIIHPILYTLISLLLITVVGNFVCRLLFKWTKLSATTSAPTAVNQRAGWIIGWLERLILAIGIFTHSWEVLVAVVALKSVTRFKELDDQQFSEYFLVGSLFSIIWAIVITCLFLAYDQTYGVNLSANISEMIGTISKN